MKTEGVCNLSHKYAMHSYRTRRCVGYQFCSVFLRFLVRILVGKPSPLCLRSFRLRYFLKTYLDCILSYTYQLSINKLSYLIDEIHISVGQNH